MSKASESHTLNQSRRHLTVGAAIRDEVRRVRHSLRRDAARHGKRAWLTAAASGLCLMMAAPMLAPSPATAKSQPSADGSAMVGVEWTDVAAPADGMTPGATICVWGRPAKVIAAPVTSGRDGFDAVTVAFTHGKTRGTVFMTLHRRGHAVEFAPHCAGRGF